jgi:hypothetical protein
MEALDETDTNQCCQMLNKFSYQKSHQKFLEKILEGLGMEKVIWSIGIFFG